MLKKMQYTISTDILTKAASCLPDIDFKISINKPTNRFFYDAWVLRDEFFGTIWEEIYNSIPLIKGEARIIKLDTTQSYTCHGDVDDRYHLSIVSNAKSYLVDLENDILYKTVTDGFWYNMDAGILHSAVNFNDQPRYQLVIRQLLNENILVDPVKVKLVPNCDRYDHRFIFDQFVSPWLNRANKLGIINEFISTQLDCSFSVERAHISNLELILPKQFSIL